MFVLLIWTLLAATLVSTAASLYSLFTADWSAARRYALGAAAGFTLAVVTALFALPKPA
ncbi:MAG TPA: hypothetical protein VF234_05555 [Limnochordia bacterium]